MMRHRNIIGALWLGAAFMMGCGKQIPKEVIQPDRMEGILYDYHLGISLSSDLSYSDNYQKEAYKNYIFEKHHITEAEFDSSMVWYTRHTKELAIIYKKLGERFRSEKNHTRELLALREHKPTVSLPGDTVDVWYDRKLYWLTGTQLTDRVTFKIPTDSNFKVKDRFLWSAGYTFLSEGKRKATMGFNILFDNDSVMGCVTDITTSGVHTLSLTPDSAFTIKSVNGFIYYLEDDSLENKPGLIVNGISLMRYHEPVDTTAFAGKDSLAVEDISQADTVKTEDGKADTLQSVVPEKEAPVRMTPREMKENNTPAHPRSARPQRMKRM